MPTMASICSAGMSCCPMACTIRGNQAGQAQARVQHAALEQRRAPTARLHLVGRGAVWISAPYSSIACWPPAWPSFTA